MTSSASFFHQILIILLALLLLLVKATENVRHAGSSSATAVDEAPGQDEDKADENFFSSAAQASLAYVDDPPVPAPIHPQQPESRLLNFLMQNYDSDVRPLLNVSAPLMVKVGITLTQIFDMDEKNQVMTTNVWLDQEWDDVLLRWDPAQFSGLKKIRIPCDKIWLPDIVLYNNADDYTTPYMRSLALVTYTGNVFWPPPTKFRSTCSVNVAFFPFDDQNCSLKLGSWLHDGYSVNITKRNDKVDLTSYVPNGEWQLLSSTIIRSERNYNISDAPFIEITVSLSMRRKTLYYMYNIVFPCMMMSTLTVLVFCLPPDSGEKIALGVTVLLAFSVFMLAIAEKMPETSESIPLIGIYLTSVMAITCVSVIMTVCVLNFFYRGPTLTPVPVWAQTYILGKKTPTRGGRIPNRDESIMRTRRRSQACMAGITAQDDSWSGLAERYSLDVLRRHIRSRQEIVSFPSRSPRGSIAQRSAASSTVAVLHHRRGSSAAAAAMSGASGGSTTAATTAPMGNGGVGLLTGNHFPLSSFPDIDDGDGEELNLYATDSRRSSRSAVSFVDEAAEADHHTPAAAEVLAAGNAAVAAAEAAEAAAAAAALAATSAASTTTGADINIRVIPPSSSESSASPTSPQIDKFSLHSSPGAEVGAAVASSHHQGNSDCRHENGCPSHAEGGALNADLFPSLHTPVLGSGSGAGGGAGGGGRGSRRGGGCGNFNREEQSDMDLALALMAERQTEDERTNEILRDWKMLAQKVDYCLFWIFLLITSLTSFTFIFVLPYSNRGKLL